MYECKYCFINKGAETCRCEGKMTDHKTVREALERLKIDATYRGKYRDADIVKQALAALDRIEAEETVEELPMDLTEDEFAEIFTAWKNQQGMNGFLTRMNVKHVIWIFECMKANGLRIVKEK